MDSMYFTSYEISKMLQVSRQAVNQWIDKQFMESHRTPGGHRRVHVRSLIGFLRERDIPVPEQIRRRFPEIVSESNSHTIILVDDNTDFLVIMEQALLNQNANLRIQKFDNAYDALMALGAKRPDLLVMDLEMPGIDGIEMCRRLQSNPQSSELPVCIVSAHAAPPNEPVLETLNLVGTFDKFFPVDQIAFKIAKMVQSVAVGVS